MALGVNRLYLNSFGSLTGPYYLSPLEATVAWLYLYAPRLQTLDWDLLTRLGALPLYVLLFAAIWMLRRGDIVFKSTVDRETAAADRLLSKIEEAHSAEITAMKAAQQREREQFEVSLQEKRLEIEQWQQRWAKAAGGAERAVELLLQQKVP